MNKSIIKRAINKAKQSICKFKIAALGFNQNGDCVITRTNAPGFNRKGGGKHAEARIMMYAKRRGITKILICRIGNSGNLLPINPCESCQKIADKLNIKIETIKDQDFVWR